jgi:acetyl esterase/lipase
MTTNHPLHPLDRVAMAEMRLMVAPMKGSVTGPAARVPFDELMESTPTAEGVTCEKADVGGLPGWWCRPGEAAADTAILYLHGGAYVVGSARAYRHFVGQVAARAKVAAFVPEYGLAPEHPFPAAAEEAQAANRGLVEQGFLKIAVAGDSAGGGLALVLLSLMVAKARDGCVGLPVGAAVMSPWTDLVSLSAGLAPFVKTVQHIGSVGDRITILGTNLAGATVVSFNGTAAAFTIRLGYRDLGHGAAGRNQRQYPGDYAWRHAVGRGPFLVRP